MGQNTGHPYGLRTVNPSAWPQLPYDEAPATPERSEPEYEIQNDWDLELPMRDGVRLLLDVYRPRRPGATFPALCSFSPYTRQLQRDSAPIGQNEAGISEFWVPRGYAHVIVDVRGTNGSGGSWDMWGPEELKDVAEVIEWVAAQPWCNGRVGMMGCSYFGMVQNQVAELRPPSLAATFPYDAMTDIYRDAFFPGGIPTDWAKFWFTQVSFLNASSGRNPNVAGLTEHFQTIFRMTYPFDCDYYRERSSWPGLDRIEVPSYFGCDWDFYTLHLRGSFDAWQATDGLAKRMLIGPKPFPGRPFSAYHQEALRWYDHFLKDLDSGVLEGPPIRLWIPGDDIWRGEQEWPLARTQYADWYLSANGSGGGLADTAPSTGGEAVIDYDPAAPAWYFGEPKLAFRSEPVDSPLEVTGPVQLNLVMSSTAEDTDWIVAYQDEAPDGSIRELGRSQLRSSHRAVDPSRSRVNQPWHPHERAEPLTPGQPEELQIGIVASANVFLPGHRVRLELSNSDSVARAGTMTSYRRTLQVPARNTVLTGGTGSRLSLPVIPR